MSDTYRIVRFYQNHEREVIETGLTREQAKRHCNDPETSSRTATGPTATAVTEKYGDWFDGFEQEDDPDEDEPDLDAHYAAHEAGSVSLQDCPPSCEYTQD